MPEYLVSIHKLYIHRGSVRVVADSIEDARKKALAQSDDVELKLDEEYGDVEVDSIELC